MKIQTKMLLIKKRTGQGIRDMASWLKLPGWRVNRFYEEHDGVSLTEEAVAEINTAFRETIIDKPLTWKERMHMMRKEIGRKYVETAFDGKFNFYNVANGKALNKYEQTLRKLAPLSGLVLTDEVIDERFNS